MLQITLNILYRWWWLLILTTLLAGVTTYLILDQQPTLYRGSALMLVGPSTSSPNPELNDLRTSGQLLETYAVLATTRPVLEGIIEDLNLDMDVDDLEENIEINTTPETQILRLRVFNEDPEQALLITNTLAERILEFSPVRPEEDGADPFRIQLQDQIDRLEDRIDNSEALVNELQESLSTATTRDERVTILNDILQERSRLSTMEQFLISLYDTLQRPATNRIEVVEPATEARQVDSQLRLQTLIGAVAGLVLGAVVAVAFEYFNDTVTVVDDLMISKDVPMLGVLHKQPGKGGIIDASSTNSKNRERVEQYRTLATRIQRFLWAPDAVPRYQPSKTLLLTGTPAGIDISDVIANLSIVLTQLGIRVVVVDANYTSSGITNVFKLTNKAGLSEAIGSEVLPERVAIEGVSDLSVVPAGKMPASSFALLASEGTDRIIENLKQEADLVILSAPELSSSETLILAPKVDAAAIVTLSGRSRRGTILNGIQNLQQNAVALIFVDQSTGLRRYLGQKASM